MGRPSMLYRRRTAGMDDLATQRVLHRQAERAVTLMRSRAGWHGHPKFVQGRLVYLVCRHNPNASIWAHYLR